ncbi:NAD(P)-binding domain superfamily [Arabidopsis suecica]|uniref:NAD(P)-binding domain superfamily n=1 Tax=Arabidopsis suecica TaxID=45249 RepID=A0A8T2C3W6_ARASU|nr:NAD(P)-binding domain superfamily [Arabidopsis suecica]
MPPFRFRIPFFSSNSPSRLSSGTSSPSPPPTPPPPPPPPSRPPFRPAGIAQPSKPEKRSKVSPSLSKSRSNVAALAASSPASQLPSSGAATPTRLVKQTNQQSASPSKKLDSLRIEEQKVTTKEKPQGDTKNVAGENINPVKEKPPIARLEEHLERKETEAVQEQRKKTEAERLVVQENKKVLPEGNGEKSASDMGQQKRKEIEKLVLQERKKVLHEGSGEKSETDQGQQKSKETEKPASQETKRPLQAVGREDATRSKTTRQISAASGSTQEPRDLPGRETKTQNRTEIHTDDNHQKTKGISTSNLANPRVTNGQGSSSMSRKIKEDIRDGINKLTWGKSNGDEKSVNVYTLTGENKGATMGIGSEKEKKDGEVHIRRGYRINPDESPNTTTMETENPKDDEAEDEARFRAYINGNTQGINNSIVVESSVSENDPGVHMSLKFEISKKEVINPPENVEEEKKPETVTATKNEPRAKVVQNFKDLGVPILNVDLANKESLVKAIQHVDVGKDSYRLSLATIWIGPAKLEFAMKAEIRRAVESEGVPYTYVINNCFDGYFLATLAQCETRLTSPPRDKVAIFGDGNTEAILNKEEDIAAYTMRAIDDPITLNKTLYINPPKNIVSQNDIIALWERKIGKTLEKTTFQRNNFSRKSQKLHIHLIFCWL